MNRKHVAQRAPGGGVEGRRLLRCKVAAVRNSALVQVLICEGGRWTSDRLKARHRVAQWLLLHTASTMPPVSDKYINLLRLKVINI